MEPASSLNDVRREVTNLIVLPWTSADGDHDRVLAVLLERPLQLAEGLLSPPHRILAGCPAHHYVRQDILPEFDLDP
jgi:hypothetical protein